MCHLWNGNRPKQVGGGDAMIQERQVSVWCRECAELHDAKLVTDDSGVEHYDAKCGIMIFLDNPQSSATTVIKDDS